MHAIPTTHPCYLPVLSHAVLTLLDMADEFGHFHAVAGICSEGWAHDLTVFTDEVVDLGEAFEDALDWAQCLAADLEIVRIVLLSSEPLVAPIVEEDLDAEDDLGRFTEAVGAFAADGVELADWLRTDGIDVRSMALWAGTASPGWLG